MSATINKNVSEANSRQDPTGLIGHDIYTPHNRSLLITTNFQIIQALRIGSPLAKLCQNLPLGAQFAVPRLTRLTDSLNPRSTRTTWLNRKSFDSNHSMVSRFPRF